MMTIRAESEPEQEQQQSGMVNQEQENVGESANESNVNIVEGCRDNEENTATEDDNDDDITVIVLENGAGDDDIVGVGWIDQDSPEMQERRRNVLLRELQRVQRASFIHFMILCLIPTSLLFIVIATVLGEDEDCESAATTCEKEPRTFINAFTTRCVCDAITVARANP